MHFNNSNHIFVYCFFFFSCNTISALIVYTQKRHYTHHPVSVCPFINMYLFLLPEKKLGVGVWVCGCVAGGCMKEKALTDFACEWPGSCEPSAP